ncbi:hypothetical protein [Microbacterium marinilacus]|nr:hypothetical protein [Microbacterium marinilacus]MBY0690386.1 hypothetical protein [Microbacterium marinilacus]
MVTDDKDFLTSNDPKVLDSQLQDELEQEQRVDIVEALEKLVQHDHVAPLFEILRVKDAMPMTVVIELVESALAHLQGRDLESAVGVYEGSGLYTIPVETALDDPSFDEIVFLEDTIQFDIFRASDSTDLTLRVTVEADCSLDGYIDKGEYLSGSAESVSLLAEWNKHFFRGMERHRMRFTLSGDFTEADAESISLTVESAEEL